jgi:hypothetical protein
MRISSSRCSQQKYNGETGALGVDLLQYLKELGLNDEGDIDFKKY